MRLVLSTAVLALAAALAAPAHAQLGSARNASEASKEVVTAAGAIGESGVKASVGVVAIPLGGVAVASGVVGSAAGASGYTDLAAGFSTGAAATSGSAKVFADFSGAPLTVADEVIIDRSRKGPPRAQPAPKVPYAAEQK